MTSYDHVTGGNTAQQSPTQKTHPAKFLRLAIAVATLAIAVLPAGIVSFGDAANDIADSVENGGLQYAAFGNNAAVDTLTADAAARLIDWPYDAVNGGAGLKIGIIDGGVNTRHPALVGSNIHVRDMRVDKSLAIPMDHGTAVAALLVGNAKSGAFKGLLPRATIYAANIFSEDANGRILGDPVAFYAAVEWMIDVGVSVINVSVTGQHDPVVARAVDLALDSGVLVVAAAGNNRGVYGRDYPAAYDGVLAATAVDAKLEIYRYASLGNHIDFAAPGVAMRMASNRGTQVLSGTSFATPFLTAAVAIAARDRGGADAEAIRRLLAADSKDLGRRGVDIVFGRGLVIAQGLVHGDAPADGLRIARRRDAGPLGPRPLHSN